MTTHLAFDRALEDALAAGPQVAPSRVVETAVRDALMRPQRRARFTRLDARAWPPGRIFVAAPAVGRSARLVLIAAAVALVLTVAAFVGARLLQRQELPDPFRTTTLVSAGTLPTAASNLLGVPLADGRILIGGYGGGASLAVLFDPASGASTPLDSGFADASLMSAGALPDGKVALLGWEHREPVAAGRSYLWVFDPAAATLSRPIETLETRFQAALAVLTDGRVLVSGGMANPESTRSLESTEVFDPALEATVNGPSLSTPRLGHATVTLDDGRVLIVGGARTEFRGRGDPILAVHALDPATGQTDFVGQIEASTRTFGGGSIPVVLGDGRVLIVGGQIGPQICCRHEYDPVRAYLFDPHTGAFGPAPDLPHTLFTAVALPDGRVVIGGYWQVNAGDPESVTDAWVGVYDPDTGVTLESRNPLTGAESLPADTDRLYSGAAVLHDGRVALFAEDRVDGGPNVVDILTVAAP